MTATGLEVFDTTVQKTMEWLGDIEEELGWEDRHRAYDALRGCLHQVRDRLPVDEVAHLSAQLPMLIRGIYYEGWDPGHGPDRSADEFLSALTDYIPWRPELDYEAIARACLKVLSRHVDAGITRHVRNSMSESVRKLWPEEYVASPNR
jgi:uncharacterized protein (DUF2267 family)